VNVTCRSYEFLIEIDEVSALDHMKGHPALFGNHCLARCVQVIAKLDNEGMFVGGDKLIVGPVLDAAESLDPIRNEFGSLGVLPKFVPSQLLRPGVRPADALVPEIEATVMRVVVPFALDFLHGIVPSHGDAGRPMHGIEVGLVRLIHDVLGEWFALVEDTEALALGFLNCEVGSAQAGGKNGAGCQKDC
jgi:hypothetical protein